MSLKLNVLALVAGLSLAQTAILPAQEILTENREKKFGAGLMVGEPTGASLKYWLSDVSAIDGLLGLSWPGDNGFTIHADYLHHFKNTIPVDEGDLSFYVGGGPRFRVRDNDDIFGIRAVGGIAYMFEDIPVDIFFEVGPVFDLTPDAKVRYTVGVGARFWF